MEQEISAGNSSYSAFRTPHSALKALLIAGLLAFIYYPTMVWMVDRWSARDSYFSHGFLIPIIAAYWVWRRRRSITESEKRSDAFGLPILLCGALLQVVSSVLRIYFLSGFSLVLVIFGTVYYLFGRQVLKAVWFPVSFLALMIPLPLLFISQTTLKMKFFVSEISAYLLNAIGIQAVREGSYIFTPHSLILVGDPCSGLRSFLAFLCLGLAFAYMSRISLWKRAVLVASGLPLAVLSNVIRVFALGFLGEVYGTEFIEGTVHDVSGIVVFVIAFICFMAIRGHLEVSR